MLQKGYLIWRVDGYLFVRQNRFMNNNFDNSEVVFAMNYLVYSDCYL